MTDYEPQHMLISSLLNLTPKCLFYIQMSGELDNIGNIFILHSCSSNLVSDYKFKGRGNLKQSDSVSLHCGVSSII